MKRNCIIDRSFATNQPLLSDDTTTVHSNPQSMSSAERAAVKTGEARGKREMMAAHPERFGLAGELGRCKRQFDEGYNQIDWSKK